MPPLIVDRVSIVVTVEILERETDKHADTTVEPGSPRDKQEVVNDDNQDVSHAAHPTPQDLLKCQAEVARLTAQQEDTDNALTLSDDARNALECQVANYRELIAGMERERPRLWDLIHIREAQLGAANARCRELEIELTDAHQTITEQSGVLDMLAGATIAAVPC